MTPQPMQQRDVGVPSVEAGGGEQVSPPHSTDEWCRRLVEQMWDGVVVLSSAGTILHCNVRFAALVGMPLASVIGSSIGRFVHASGRDRTDAMLAARQGRGRSWLIGPDGGSLEVSLSVTAADAGDDGRLNLVVTDLRGLSADLGDLEDVERESRMKDEFLSMLAHELRNPISAIRRAIHVLASPHSDGDTEARARDMAARQVGSLAGLVDGLLDVDRVISGQVSLDRQPLDLAVLVRRSVDDITGDAGLDRAVDVSAEPVWIDGDTVRIEQVVLHILTNAVKFTQAGDRIRVALSGDGDSAVLTVADTGVGISPELLPLVFGVFTQGDRTLARTVGGLGLGLPLVRRLVELHGGTVGASSAGAGRGSTFTVRLPQIAAPEPLPAAARALGPVASKRVLVIEDNRDARDMLRLLLEFEGHVVDDAADGVRGLELLEEHPDVAIVDIGLPGMDGYQVARRIRQHPHGRAMLLVALTGYGLPSDHQISVDAGFDHHFVKPVDLDVLVRLLG